MEKAVLNTPPGPSTRFPTKILRKMLRDPLQTFADITKEYGEISYFRLGRQHAFLINNPDYIEKVLIYDHKNFKKGKRLQAAKRILGEGLVTSEGEMHDNQKKIIHPFFLPKKISSFGNIMSSYALKMCLKWKDGSTIDIHKEMAKVTLAIICKSMMDYDMQTKEADQFGKAFAISKDYSKRLQNPIGHVLDSIPVLPKVVESRQAAKNLDSIVYRLMETRKKEIAEDSKNNQNFTSKDMRKIRRDDLLTGLLLLSQKGSINLESNNQNSYSISKGDIITSGNIKDRSTHVPDLLLTDQQIRDHIITMLIAGHETTANALTWTYYLLAQYPEIEQKVFDEIDMVLKNKPFKKDKEVQKTNLNSNQFRIPLPSDLPKLKYLEKVFRESMRLYPPVWSIGRIVEEDYIIGDYTIPKDSALFMSQYVMHRNPKYYANPDQFIPERWTEDFKRHLPRFSYFPFGGGIRGCIGEPFAWQEGLLLIATISSYWKMTLKPQQKVKMDPGITLNPKNGIKMILQKRQS